MTPAYQWYSGAGVATGSGNNTATYTVAPADAGNLLTCHVTETNADGSSTPAVSAAVITASGTTVSGLTVTGTATAGNTLTCNLSLGAGPYSYQWIRGDFPNTANISGAISSTYLLTAADSGVDVSCQATNAAGVLATSTPIAVSGSAMLVVDAYVGNNCWSRSDTPCTNMSDYIWMAQVPAAGTYIVHVVNESTEHNFRLTGPSGNVIFTRVGTAATDEFTITFAAGTYAFQCIPHDHMHGTIVVGAGVAPPFYDSAAAQPTQTPTTPFVEGTPLTCNDPVGGWTGIPSFTYTWERGNFFIPGANSKQYVVTSADTGDGTVAHPGGAVRCVIIATNAGGSLEQRAATAVQGAPGALTNPTVSGAVTLGATLTCTNGIWQNTSGPTYTYQWRRNGVNIAGATGTLTTAAPSTTYVVTADDVGQLLVCRVVERNGPTATNPNMIAVAYSTEPANTGVPAVTGGTTLGATLSCGNGTWSPAPVSYAYQWQREGSDVSGATGATHVITADDQGKILVCKVTAADASGSATAGSTWLAVPAAAPVVSPPTPTPPVSTTVLNYKTAIYGKLTVNKAAKAVALAYTCGKPACVITVTIQIGKTKYVLNPTARVRSSATPVTTTVLIPSGIAKRIKAAPHKRQAVKVTGRIA